MFQKHDVYNCATEVAELETSIAGVGLSKLRTMASDTVDPIDWSLSTISWA